MADDGGGGGGGEGGGGAEWLLIFDRVQAQVQALAADRARLEAADRVQRESWEAARRLQRSVEELQAAAREKDAEIDRLRAEAADARKKLQADASRRGRWEAAYVELLLGANQKLAELRDSDLENSRTLAENPSFKEVESCTKLNQNTTDHTASDLSAELRKLKQAYETLSSKKDEELSVLLSEKDSVRNQLSIMQQDYAKLLKNKKVEAEQATEAAQKLRRNIDKLKVLAQNKDHEISILRTEAVDAKKNLQKMHSLVKEKDYEIQTLKGQHPEYVQKHNKDISETNKKSRSGDPAVTVRDKPENSGIRQTVEEDYISETRTMENIGQDESSHKLRRASSMSNDDEKNGSDEDDDEQTGSEEDGDKQTGNDEGGDKQTGSDEDGGEQSGSGEDGDGDDNDMQSGSDEETTHNQVQKPLGNPKRKRDTYNNEQSGSDEDGGEQSGSGEDGDDNDEQSGSDEETTHNQAYNNEDKGSVMIPWYWRAPAPLRSRKLKIRNGRHFFEGTGHWGQYVKAVNDSLVDQPDKHKEFVRFMHNFESWRIRQVARTMEVVLDGQPKLIRQFNHFLPNNCQIKVDDDEEKQQPEEEQPRPRGVPRPCGQLPSASPSASAAAGLIKLKEAEQQSKWERV